MINWFLNIFGLRAKIAFYGRRETEDTCDYRGTSSQDKELSRMWQFQLDIGRWICSASSSGQAWFSSVRGACTALRGYSVYKLWEHSLAQCLCTWPQRYARKEARSLSNGEQRAKGNSHCRSSTTLDLYCSGTSGDSYV